MGSELSRESMIWELLRLTDSGKRIVSFSEASRVSRSCMGPGCSEPPYTAFKTG